MAQPDRRIRLSVSEAALLRKHRRSKGRAIAHIAMAATNVSHPAKSPERDQNPRFPKDDNGIDEKTRSSRPPKPHVAR
jgi:hypothetical protein